MARTPMLERSGSLKVLGAAFIALMLFFLWVTYAFFTKAFVDYDAGDAQDRHHRRQPARRTPTSSCAA